MDVYPSDSDQIQESDIIFDCPHCGKSLAIEYRGAGLTVPCTDCGNDVVVPIPEGLELDDIDSSPEDQEVRIMHLRRSLQNAHDRIAELENTVEDLLQRRDRFEKTETVWSSQRDQVLERIGHLESGIGSMQEDIRSLSELFRDSDGDDA